MTWFCEKRLSSDEKQELLEVIESFRNHHIPLVVPITLMNHYVRKYDEQYHFVFSNLAKTVVNTSIRKID